MASVQMTVKGMSCQGCVRSIERRLTATPGVQHVSVRLETGLADIDFDDSVINAGSIERVIEDLGFDVVYGMGKHG